MRIIFPIAALSALLLSACASSPEVQGKAVVQSGTLKVHPGLLGLPVPPELQNQDTPAAPADSGPGQNGR